MPDRDEFFVGYLSTPPGLGRWTLALAACALLVMLGSAIVIAARQRDPGDGKWESAARQIEGFYVDSPYPMLQTADAAVLLVGEGKVVARRDASLRNRKVRATGTLLHRGNLTLLEVTALTPSPGTPGEGWGEGPRIQPANTKRELRGEIIDPKCFAGAMKPGDGKTHKGCAALCLRGGIPPVFRAADALYLLLDQDLKPLDGDALQRVIDHVGDDVTVTGGVTSIGHMQVLAIDAATIRRWAP